MPTDYEVIAKADRAKAAMEEFFGPAFDEVEREWYEAMIATARSTDPERANVVMRLTDGIAAVRRARKKIEEVITAGSLAEADAAREAQLSRIRPDKRVALGV